MPKSRNAVLIVLAFFSIYIIWGSTYLWNKITVTELPPYFLASIRFITAGVLIFTIAKILGYKTKISWRQFRNTVIAGILFLTIGNGLAVWALQYLDSGFAALEISAQPLVVLLVMRVVQSKKIKSMSIIGIVLGLIGMYLLVSQKQIVTDDKSVIGAIMIVVCMLSWAFGSIFVAEADLPKNYFVNTGYQMITGGGIMALTSLAIGEQWSSPLTWSGDVQVSMTLLIVFGGIVAFTSFNYLLKFVSPEKVATSAYVNPIVAMILGWYFLNEEITTQSIVAAAVLLSGVYFINTTKAIGILPKFKR